MCARERGRPQGFLRLVRWPSPGYAEDEGRLVPGGGSRGDPVPTVPSPVDALTRIQEVQLNHLHREKKMIH
jgi:hypothetical protein